MTKEIIMEKYSDKHYEKVAKVYKRCKGNVSKMQDHYPDTSLRSVQRWVKVCRERGLV
jgi:hypothetical protein